MALTDLYKYAVVNTNTTVTIKALPGVLHSISVTSPGTTWVANVYDSTGAATSPIAGFPAITAAGTYIIDVGFLNGLTVITSGTTPGSITLTYV